MKPAYVLLSMLSLGCFVLAGCGTAGPIAPTAIPTLPPTPTPAMGAVLWTFATADAIWSSPAVSAGTAYFGSDDMSLYAVDVQTHQLRWKFATGGFVRSHPAVVDQVVYISSDDGFLYALDATTGIEKWRADLGSANLPVRKELGVSYDYQQSSPAVADGRVYVGSGAGGVYAIDAATGQQVWKFQTPERVRSSPAVADGRVFVGDGYGYLRAIDAATGTEVWNALGCDIPSPAVADGLVYCGSRGFYEVRAWDVQTGELRWKYPVGHSWVDSSPRIVGDSLYIGSSDAASLFALDPLTGVLKWKFPTRGYAWCSPAVADGVAYIGSYMIGTDGEFYAVDAGSGVLRWSLTVKSGVVSSPTVVDGVVYFGGMDGSLYAVEK